jgi:hypothetical protein
LSSGLTAKLDIIEQNANDLALSSVAIKDSRLHFQVDAAQAKYEEKIDESATSIQGDLVASQSVIPNGLQAPGYRFGSGYR